MQASWIKRQDDDMNMEVARGTVRATGEMTFFVAKDENQKDLFHCARVKEGDNYLIMWSPKVEQFKTLIKAGELPGKVTEDSVLLDKHKPEALKIVGDPGHRWLTVLGEIDGGQAVMNITMTSGGIFDDPAEIDRTDPPGSDGTIILTFESCSSGTFEYNITSINRQCIIPIRRIADDNMAICEALNSE